MSQDNNNTRQLLKTKEVAAILGIGKSTLDQDRLSGRLGLPFVRLGHSVRYKRQDVEKFISSLQGVFSTSQKKSA